MRAAQVHLHAIAQKENRLQIEANHYSCAFGMKLIMSYTETGHQAGQVDMAWSKHVQLLQARDGSCLHKGVRVVLHYGTTNKAGGADGGDSCSISWQTHNDINKGEKQNVTALRD